LFGTFDEEDVEGTLIDVHEKIAQLEASYSAVHDFFNDVKDKNDDEAYLRFLGGDDSEDGEQKRQIFTEYLNDFLRNLDECLVLQDFVHEFKHMDTYRKEVKKLVELRKSANIQFAERVDFGFYKRALTKILDRYVDAQGVELLTKQINITDRKELEEAVGSLGSDKSKAEAIAALTEKTINDKMQTDPEFYQRFSDKVSDILKKMREGKMADIEALKNLKEISESVLTKQDDTIPKEIEEVTGADVFFRNLSPVFTTKGTSPEKQITITLAIFELLKKEAIVDWHKNAEVKRVMKNKIDDYLYDTVKGEMDIELSNDDTHSLVEDVMLLAEHNHELFKA
jgi:type I restriction enzyme R subunit